MGPTSSASAAGPTVRIRFPPAGSRGANQHPLNCVDDVANCRHRMTRTKSARRLVLAAVMMACLMPSYRKKDSADSSLPPFGHAAVERAEHKVLHAVRV